ncbi:MAG TPA: hypothetical protein VK009_25015 [Chloroflexota bacterium]|nr:hypothetical protein [Chloroflexota bacterium]
MDREAHLKLSRDTLKACGQLLDYWDKQVQAKGPIGDWPSVDLDRFGKDIFDPLKFLKDELGRQLDELRRHDLGVSHNDFGDSGRARGIREAAAKRASS